MVLSVSLPHGPGYMIHFASLDDAPGILAREGLRKGRCIVVTDTNVAARLKQPLCDALRSRGWTPKAVVLPPGEATKSQDSLQIINDAALGWGIDRETPIIALGGGVIGDLAGFAAATLLRGLPLVQVPTTLIAQVDSAIGGKTGINHVVGKNLIGAFHQPRTVITDFAALTTLPERQWTSGLAEVVKHALIADPTLFELLERDWPSIVDRHEATISDIVPRAAKVKARIVSLDEKETGRRAILNFGHTFGHAIEREAGYGYFTHGEAIALGMRAALHQSSLVHADEDFDRADRLVRRIPAPKLPSHIRRSRLMAAMRSDKKVRAGKLRLVLLRRLGEAYVTTDVPARGIEAAWRYVGVKR